MSDQPVFTTRFDENRLNALRAELGDGPLRGLTFAVKDNIDVAGVPSTAACPTRTVPAVAHATAVARLLRAGALPVGKTNMDQFATGLVGTRSPYGACHCVSSDAHISGGSSSGSAVAVASGLASFALGTDTAGSGRVPAAFNGLVGTKPTRGLVPNTGLLPASPSLDCISILTDGVALARAVFDELVGADDADPYSRTMPVSLPPGVARQMRVIAVPDPSVELDLDDAHRAAWERALEHAAGVATLVPFDVTPLLAAAKLLYGGGFVAERLAAFGALLEPDGPHLDPVVRSIVLGARALSAADAFDGFDRLARLRGPALQAFAGADALLLPVTPCHPTLAEVAADPIGVNARLGTYTNMVNLLDLCAVAVPAGVRDDGLPFGVQLIAPAFADRPLLELAGRWLGEPVDPPIVGPDRTLLAVAGAHLSGQPRNGDLVELGGRLHSRVRTADGYRMLRVPGPFPRPGLVRDGGAGGIEMELWELPQQGLAPLLSTVAPPLAFGAIELDDLRSVTGFVATETDDAEDITAFGSWRAYLASRS